MKLWNRYRKWILWLISLAAFFAVYFSLRQSRTAMNWLCGRVLLPIEQGLGSFFGGLSISVAETVIISGLCAAFFGVVNFIRGMVTRPQKKERVCRFCLSCLGVGLSVYAGFCLLWGTFYNTDSFQQRSGITARGGTVAELTALTEKFAGYVRDTAGAVHRNAAGQVELNVPQVLADSVKAYDALYGEFPFLAVPTAAPKAFTASRAMSAMDFTGFYFPFTGEANVNVDAPPVYLPATCCHEIAHQKGVSSEQECNFLGILAALRSGDADFRYSGALMGYIYVSNALYAADYDAWQAIRDTLPQETLRDLQQQRDYWAQFEGPVKTVSTKVYDGFLKANGDKNGIRSYGTVVDLLLAYNIG